MPTYVYKLKDESGKTLYGFTEADNKNNLKEKMRNFKYYFISAEVVDRKKIFESKVSIDTLLVFTRRLGSLIESGIPFITAMNILWRQSEDKTIQLVVCHMRNRLEEGKNISMSMSEFPKMFNPMYLAMITVAEKAGGLVAILKRLISYLEYHKLFITRTKKAILYPSIVAGFAVLVVIVMFVVLVPQFAKVLGGLRVELPGITKLVIAISNLMRSPVFIFSVIGILTLGTMIFRYLMRDPKFAKKVDYYLLKIPFIGDILYSLSLGRFVRSLAMLVGAGLPIFESFDIAKTTTANRYIVEGVNITQQRLQAGNSLYESFKEARMFPVLFTEMIGVGETSGSIVKSFDSLADHFDEEVDYKQNKFFTMLEPALMIFVGGIVIFTLLAIYMPIFSIWDGLMNYRK